jgi:hypothetical protein
MSSTTALFILAAAWVGAGLLVALVMGRHGHDPFAWWLLGTVLGPLVVPLVISAERHRAERARLVRAGEPGRGPVDVLVGIDGSPEAAAALATVLDLLGPRLGRLALATVTDLDASVEHDQQQAQACLQLQRQAETVRAWLSTSRAAPARTVRESLSCCCWPAARPTRCSGWRWRAATTCWWWAPAARGSPRSCWAARRPCSPRTPRSRSCSPAAEAHLDEQRLHAPAAS